MSVKVQNVSMCMCVVYLWECACEFVQCAFSVLEVDKTSARTSVSDEDNRELADGTAGI